VDVLGFPDKTDKRAQPGLGWTLAELNSILQDHVVNGALTSFGCVEFESELFLGTMCARCYPFDMPMVIRPDMKGHGIWEHLTVRVICWYATSYDGICQVVGIPDA
jgi:hypothetical protein